MNLYVLIHSVSNKDKLTVQVSVRALCYRSMRKSEAPEFESRQEAVFIPVQWCLLGLAVAKCRVQDYNFSIFKLFIVVCTAEVQVHWNNCDSWSPH